VQWRLRPESRAAGQARRDAVRWLAAQGLPGGTTDDVAVIIAELLANAIRVAPRTVVLDLEVAAGRCHVTVTDDGPGFRELPPDTLPPLEAEGSRGLFLVRTLSRGFAVQKGPAGTVVCCWLPVSFAAAPGS
jgi:anti-sigma regulatory factor (Ser/Thr protein kinase)